jgi:hypothetical protein
VLLTTVVLAVGAAWAALAGRRLLPLVAIAAIAVVDLLLILFGASTR